MADLLAERGAKRRLAQRLGVAQGEICNWINGSRRPVAKTRAKLQKMLGIKWTLWDEPADPSKGAA